MFCCLRNCFHHHGQLRKPNGNHLQRAQPEIFLDASHMGPDIVLLSNQSRITGSGGILATAPLVQSKSYFEIKIQQTGCWSVGLATRQADLTRKIGGSDKFTWCLCSDNATRHDNEEIYRPVVVSDDDEDVVKENATATKDATIKATIENVLNDDALDVELSDEQHVQHNFPDEGDVVGVAFDHVELNFYFNGKNLDVPFRNVKGDALYPVLFVGNGATLDIILDNFHFGPPPGFDRIMLEQSLL